MSELTKLLREEISKREREVAALRKALETIEGKPKAAPSEPAPKPKPKARGTRISTERMQFIRDTVIEIAKTKTEFRQIDMREARPEISSSILSESFKQMREENFIRLSRRVKGHPCYRLTNEAMNEMNTKQQLELVGNAE